MAQKAEYKAIHSKSATELSQQLNTNAAQGWRPILMTAVGDTGGTIVILEHKIGE